MERFKTVWGVSRGEYSDYSVVHLFERKEDAEADALIRNKGGEAVFDKAFVEEFRLYGPGQKPEYQDNWHASVSIGPDDTTIPGFPAINRPELDKPGPRRPDVIQFQTQSGATCIRGHAADRDAVLKAVEDRAAAVIAQRQALLTTTATTDSKAIASQ